MTKGRMLVSLAVLVMFLGVAMLSQQSAAADSVISIQEAPEETAPPAETTPPETAPPDAGDSETPWWVLLIVLGGLFILIVALLAGSRRKKAPSPAATPVWRTHARNGYAESRWLADNMTESLAIWHGDAEFEERDATLATDAANAKIWAQLDPVQQRATAELYALEAAAGPGSPALGAAQRTTAAVNETYAATTERSDARLAYRNAAASSDAADRPADLAAARDREVRASARLEAAHQELTAALVELSPIA